MKQLHLSSVSTHSAGHSRDGRAAQTRQTRWFGWMDWRMPRLQCHGSVVVAVACTVPSYLPATRHDTSNKALSTPEHEPGWGWKWERRETWHRKRVNTHACMYMSSALFIHSITVFKWLSRLSRLYGRMDHSEFNSSSHCSFRRRGKKERLHSAAYATSLRIHQLPSPRTQRQPRPWA